MPESKPRQKTPYVPPPKKKDPVKLGPSRWVAPTMVALFVLGLIWIVVFYIAGSDVTSVPLMGAIAALPHGNLWNVLVGFGLIGGGFIVATRWR
ncbi:MAG: cell division protein CrgA [Actinobacteria bacterium]|nr:cell division protein CrgA [Actinomycetota bacterium]